MSWRIHQVLNGYGVWVLCVLLLLVAILAFLLGRSNR